MCTLNFCVIVVRDSDRDSDFTIRTNQLAAVILCFGFSLFEADLIKLSIKNLIQKDKMTSRVFLCQEVLPYVLRILSSKTKGVSYVWLNIVDDDGR